MAVECVPPLRSPNSAGFSGRIERQRFELHLDAVRLAARRGAPVTLISETRSVLEPPTLAVVERQIDALPAEWDLAFLAHPPYEEHLSTCLYAVRQHVADALVAHLEGFLAGPSGTLALPRAIERAFTGFAERRAVLAR